MSSFGTAGNPRNIVFLPSLLSESDCATITNFCELTNEWKSSSYDGSKDMGFSVQNKHVGIYSPLVAATNIIKFEIEQHFGRELPTQYPSIRRWDAGDSQPLHADGEDLEGNPNESYAVDYASVLYINDDYSGGEICFPLQGLTYKPKAGTAVFFPANRWYMHSVSTVQEGTRYTAPTFWVPTKHTMLKDFYSHG